MSQDHANHAVHVDDEISVSPPTSSPSGSDQTAPFDEFLRATTPAVGQPHAYYQPAPNPATPFYQHPRGIAGIGHSIAQSLARSARSTASSLTRRSSAQPPIPPATPYFYYPWTNYNQPPYMMPSVPPHPQSAYGGTTSVATSGIQMGSLSRDENGDSMLRRHIQMIKQDVELTNGEFILDIPLSREYVESVCETGDEEFTHLRYTACTKKADDFAEFYTLRQQEKGRRTKIAVVCTMYNEDDQLLTKTMSAVMDNIAYLCSMKGRKGWDQDSWKDIVVVLISDGKSQCNKRSLDILSAMGMYMEGLPRSDVNGEPVQAHIFELTTQVRIDNSLVPQYTTGQSDKIVPMQTIFLLKEKNAKKINSHRWFFNGLCKILDPEVCILIDVGTKPTKQSFWHLYRAFQRNENVAGACGEIFAELGSHWQNLYNPLVATQNFEYKMSNILDKPLESVLGYIAVLPGAFSAYRYQALQGTPLESYFKGEALHNDHCEGRPNVSESNMYLAEDRILCFELVMKRDKRYILKYVKSARAETDVPTELHDLIKQRRRWLNGSFFASVYSVSNYYRLFLTKHTFFRMFLLTLETIYNLANIIYSWFSIASIYVCFFFMFNLAASEDLAACTQAVLDSATQDPFFPIGPYMAQATRGIYIASFVSIVVASLGNKPTTIKPLLSIVTIIFGICMALMLTLICWTVYLDIKNIPPTVKTLNQFIKYVPSDPNFMDLAISLMCTYVMYIVVSIVYLDPWHPFTCLIQYLLMSPSFSNVLMVYAFCNIHDISWGTKGQDTASVGVSVEIHKNEKGKMVATTEVPAPDYATELAKLKEMVAEMKNPHAVVTRSKDVKSAEDHFKSFRTNVLLCWFISNFALAYMLTNEYVIKRMGSPGRANPFLVFLLWSVAGLTGIRFTGATVYIIQWLTERAVDMF
ncbi:hypothetical protein BCR33DRAFT_12012 [Rhizoclosmatium globosum]|uniref:Chitin synthase n=1 Tax=Rhizoclosmatium globosum TaxID=329046 RepID=A0A1Y2CP90_9FUNG|nr:hypothetical protein BCR33DRAFT_12012 [Rhizoclosmatium globosum]|eukprot:ORY48848.1 hypothetical protein BCR33DRAFT_12012 [Rhizoclosmatium globosum]